MTTHELRDLPEPALAQALATFETQFTYPLGPGRHFRLSHGMDYPRFFRAMGDNVSLVEDDGRVLGVVGIALRRLLLPEGREVESAYLGDLKVDPTVRKTFVYFRLAWAALAWLRGKESCGFGVVMDGTRATPDAYTGSFGIPAARVLGKILVWQFPCSTADPGEALVSDSASVRACYRKLSQGRYAGLGSNPAERSEMDPVWLMLPDGAGCGLVEDTRRCKRLIADDGAELRSGHLSYFAYRQPADGARLIRAAQAHAARAGHPAIFVAVAPCDAPALEEALGPHEKVVAPATVFGAGLDDGLVWNINTSEI